jgi:deoxyribose-phosphate aldolase
LLLLVSYGKGFAVTQEPDAATIARLIDHTLLKPAATTEQIARLCEEAREYRFASVCVNPVYVQQCVAALSDVPEVAVCAVIGFPLGATLPAVKMAEAEQVLALGASEIDMVQHIGALTAGRLDLLQEDIAGVVAVAHRFGGICKVILETALLTDEEKETACRVAQAAGADFVKTSTGFGPGGATVEDVALMRRVVGPRMGVKASGGVRTYADVLAMIDAGATRIGASAGVQIVQEARGQSSGNVSDDRY